jgi:hypothetical protein
MSARKLVYQGLVLGPVVLLGYLGLGARAYQDPFEFRSFTATDEAVMMAYVVPMRAIAGLTGLSDDQAGRAAVRHIARVWVSEFRRGKLKPLPSDDPSMGPDFGAKDEVLLARWRILAELGRVSQVDERDGLNRDAADDLVLALEVAQIAKQTDLGTLRESANRQSALVRRLESIANRLSPGERRGVALRLVAIAREDRKTIEYLVARQGRIPFAAADVSPRTAVPGMLRDAKNRTMSQRSRPGSKPSTTGYLTSSSASLLLASCFSQEAQYSAMRAIVDRLGVRRKWDYEAWSRGPHSG